MRPASATWSRTGWYTGRRWYLLAWDTQRADWRTYRADRITPRMPAGPRFTVRQPPNPDIATHVLRGITARAWTYPAQVRLHAPAAEIAGRIAPIGGVLTTLDDETCLLETGGNSLLDLAGYPPALTSRSTSSTHPNCATCCAASPSATRSLPMGTRQLKRVRKPRRTSPLIAG